LFKQQGEVTPAGFGLQQVRVVEHEQERLGCLQRLAQPRQNELVDGRRAYLQQVGDGGVHGCDPAQRRGEVAEEDDGVVVGGGELQPRRRDRGGVGPLREQCTLAVPRRRRHDDQ
jgi:hypothetical protein